MGTQNSKLEEERLLKDIDEFVCTSTSRLECEARRLFYLHQQQQKDNDALLEERLLQFDKLPHNEQLIMLRRVFDEVRARQATQPCMPTLPNYFGAQPSITAQRYPIQASSTQAFLREQTITFSFEDERAGNVFAALEPKLKARLWPTLEKVAATQDPTYMVHVVAISTRRLEFGQNLYEKRIAEALARNKQIFVLVCQFGMKAPPIEFSSRYGDRIKVGQVIYHNRDGPLKLVDDQGLLREKFNAFLEWNCPETGDCKKQLTSLQERGNQREAPQLELEHAPLRRSPKKKTDVVVPDETPLEVHLPDLERHSSLF